MSVAALARACNVRAPSVHDWESGRTRQIAGDHLFAAANALNVRPEWILSGRLPRDATGAGGVAERIPERQRIEILARSFRDAFDAFHRAGAIPNDLQLAALVDRLYEPARASGGYYAAVAVEPAELAEVMRRFTRGT